MDQDGGEVEAATSITGDVDVDGTGSKLTTALLAGNLTQHAGTVAADEVTGTATLDLDGHALDVGGYRDFTASDGGSPRVTSAKAAALKVSTTGTVNCWARFEEAAGLCKAGTGTFVLQRASSTTGTLEVAAGTVSFGTGGGWSAGHEVKIGATGRIAVSRSGTLAREAVVRVAAGGKIELAEGAVEHVAELWIGGAKQSPGAYTAAKVPDVFVGAGTLIVGNVGTMVIFR